MLVANQEIVLNEGSSTTPRIVMHVDKATISITGRSLAEEPAQQFSGLFRYFPQLPELVRGKLRVVVCLHKLNDASLLQLVLLAKMLDKLCGDGHCNYAMEFHLLSHSPIHLQAAHILKRNIRGELILVD